MTLQRDTSNLKDAPSKSNNTLATNCVHCDQKFKERDDLTIIEGKVLHQNCATIYLNQIEIQKYKIEFPYLSEAYIDRMIYTEGEDAFDTIRDNSWIILISLGSQEITTTGFPDESGVEEFIINHYEQEDNEQNASIAAIYNNGTEYHYSVNITVALSEA